jgi:hypothetical protein
LIVASQLIVTPAATLHAAQLCSTIVIHCPSIFSQCAFCVFIVEAVVPYGLVDLGWCAAGII